MKQVRSVQGDTIDLICHRYFGRTAGVTEAVIKANPGLSELSPILPSATLVTLPDVPPPPENTLTQLWS